LDCVVEILDTTFSTNYAEIKGGAIHWDTIEPVFGGITSNGDQSSIKYKGNKAGRYGDNISCFPQQIAIIDEKDFKSTMFSTNSFLDGGKRLLQENDTQVIKNVSFSTEKALAE